jgi:hypothetical protein
LRLASRRERGLMGGASGAQGEDGRRGRGWPH